VYQKQIKGLVNHPGKKDFKYYVYFC
jgi:hypothetical protein